jgi:hypothetical protein
LTIQKYILTLVIFLVAMQTVAQEHDVTFSGNLTGLPFSEFVDYVEQQTDAHFFYLEDWIKEIRISISGDQISLQRTLSNVLPGAGLYFYIDEDLKIFIYTEQAIIFTLPDYSVKDRSSGISPDGEQGNDLTNIEQRYIEGRKSGLRETIVIGTESGSDSQSGVVVYGKVVDRVSREPLIGATIYVKELEKGVITDVDGRFSMVLRPGKYSVDFNCMGMEEEEYYLDVHSGGNLDIFMNRGLIPIKEVVIEAKRFNNVKGIQMGFERLNYKSVKEIPMAFGEKDMLKVAQMLPGVQNVGEGATGFNVRGSAADQNMICVNKVPVYNSSHLFGFFSSFSPDIVKDFSLYKSNLPANYGGRLASFLDISTRQGNLNNYTARGGISPITGHIAVEGPVVKNKSAFVLSARSTYSDWILKRLDDLELRNSDASFYDLAGTLTFEPNEKNLIKTFGYYSSDKFSLGSTNQYDYANAGASVNLKHRFNSRISGDLAGVFGEYAFQMVDESLESFAFSHDYRINHYELKTDLNWLSLGSHKLSLGGNVIYYMLDRGNVKPYGDLSLRIPVDLGVENAVETALYFADEITITPRLTLYGGLRYSYYLALGAASVLEFEEGLPKIEANIIGTQQFGAGEVIKRYSGPEPRISFNYLLGSSNSVKFSYNRVRQYLFMLTNTTAISPTDQWKLCDYNISPPFIDQLSAGYYHDFDKIGFSTSLEAYYKMVSNVKEYRDGASFIDNPNIELEILEGDQKAYGLEMMARKNTGRFNGWIAYTYSRSTMHFKSNFPGESINGGVPYPSNYDRPHNLNIVSNLKLDRRFSFSLNMVYTTGRPVTYPISIYYINRIQHIYYSQRNEYRIPDYFRIDLSVNIEGNLKRKKIAHSFWMLNFYNLTGRKNAYSVYFKNEDGAMKGYKLSIFDRLLVTLSWNFKIGNYSSE